MQVLNQLLSPGRTVCHAAGTSKKRLLEAVRLEVQVAAVQRLEIEENPQHGTVQSLPSMPCFRASLTGSLPSHTFSRAR